MTWEAVDIPDYEGTKEAGIIVGRTGDTERLICYDCAKRLKRGRDWIQTPRMGTCGGCDADLV